MQENIFNQYLHFKRHCVKQLLPEMLKINYENYVGPHSVSEVLLLGPPFVATILWLTLPLLPAM